MKHIVLLAAFSVGFTSLRAQMTGCSPCTQQNVNATFSPPVVEIDQGQEVEAVVQFTLPDSARVNVDPSTQITVFPNYAIFVDSLRMEGGATYVSLRGNPNIPVSYNSANPQNGALRFDQMHRYKQVFPSGSNQFANVVVYRNPGRQAGPTPPRGCVRACIRGKAPTPTADSLRILLRAFVDPNSLAGSDGDIDNKDTTNVMPTIFGRNLWADTLIKYPVRVRTFSSIAWQAVSALQLYPNPAIGNAMLRYKIERPSAVSIHIYSITGSLLKEEALGLRQPGAHEYPIHMPAGIYLVELRTETESLKEKIVLIE